MFKYNTTFAAQYPHKPSPNTVKKNIETEKISGTYKSRIERKPILKNENPEIAISGCFIAYPVLSLRQVESEFRISKEAIRRISKNTEPVFILHRTEFERNPF